MAGSRFELRVKFNFKPFLRLVVVELWIEIVVNPFWPAQQNRFNPGLSPRLGEVGADVVSAVQVAAKCPE